LAPTFPGPHARPVQLAYLPHITIDIYNGIWEKNARWVNWGHSWTSPISKPIGFSCRPTPYPFFET
jgi:hypothetical protein